MPNLEFERLQIIGSFGLDEGIGYGIISRKVGGGRRRSYLYGPRQGERSWNLVYNVLPDTMDNPVQTNPVTQEARATYLWNFFCRHKTGYDDIDRPFIIKNLGDNKDYLVVFADQSMSRKLFMTKLYSTGLKLEQVSVPGVATLPDGSLGESLNPDEI